MIKLTFRCLRDRSRKKKYFVDVRRVVNVSVYDDSYVVEFLDLLDHAITSTYLKSDFALWSLCDEAFPDVV